MGSQARRPRWAVVGLVVYVSAVAAVVFAPVSYGDVIAAFTRWLHDGTGLVPFGAGWVEFAANVLMFVPLGLLLTVLMRHHLWGATLALALSVTVELVQVLIPERSPSLRDVLANGLGAAVGAAIAWLVVLRRRGATPPDGGR
ncbi:VanZ family protein [Microbacterium sp. NPDC058389]|uniref:VanZ family protein n=1 Tax=Microbacterium sp. NPDC058389 TaxID=3346475 RepID=UPI00364786CF